MTPSVIEDPEARRLKALRQYNLFGTEAEQDFDDIAALAAQICDAPIAIISLVEIDRQWFKATIGLPFRQLPREGSFCTRVVEQKDLFVVPDATTDARFQQHPFVAKGVRFYAGVPLTTPDGFAVGALCVMDRQARALTEAQANALRALARQVIAQCELRSSEADYRLLFTTNPNPMWVFDLETLRFLAVNEAAVLNYGYSLAEFYTMTLNDIRPAEDIPRLLETIKGGHTDHRRHLDFRHRRKDGTVFEVEIRSNNIQFGGKKARLVLAIDVTASRKTEADLRESESRLRQLAENVEEVFWIVSANSNEILYISPSYERVWGRSVESLYRSPTDWADAILPEDRPRMQEVMRTKQATNGYKEVYRIERPDGTIRWIQDRAYPIRDAQGKIYRVVGTAKDITEQRALESQMRQAQKLEAIGTLAGGIAHDFNNILGAIIGYTELARLDAAPGTDQVESLKEVLKASTRAKDLVNQILTFSRQQEQKRSPIQLRHVVAEALRLLRAAAPATIQFKTDLSAAAPIVLADATQIHQIIMNLGTNALHAMRDVKGVLTIRLEPVQLTAEQTAHHPELAPGLYARLTVEDVGHGMDAATLQRAFEPFFTTKPYGEGTGLGLSVVHGIVTSHGGFIEAASEPGKGARFTLHFPAIARSEVRNDTENIELPRGNGEHILMIDDEPAILNSNKKMLELLGYRVSVESNPVTAVEEALAAPEKYSLIITDLTMPVMTGLDVASRLRTVPAPIILMTGRNTSATSDAIASLGIRDTLLKPFSKRGLAEAIHRTLAMREGA